jgi:hypothetical protein
LFNGDKTFVNPVKFSMGSFNIIVGWRTSQLCQMFLDFSECMPKAQLVLCGRNYRPKSIDFRPVFVRKCDDDA